MILCAVHGLREVCIMHPANISHNLESIMEAVRLSNSKVVLIAVTWNVIMTPRKLTGRRTFRRSRIAYLALTFICVLFTIGGVALQHSGNYYVENSDKIDTSLYNVENWRINKGKFLLKPRNQKVLYGQYYFNKFEDATQKRNRNLFDHINPGYSLEWGYDAFMNRVSVKPKCTSRALLLILITSAPANSDQRKAIRNTWCSNDAKSSVRPTQSHTSIELLDWHCVFLIGRDNNAETNAKVLKESQYFSDILYGDYEDTYRNLSYKVLTGLHWSQFNCSLQFVLKTDDDCFVNINLLPEFLLSQQVDQSVLYAGNAADQEKRAYVIRDPLNKWSVTREEYAPDLYPPYASGTGYVLSQDVLSRMLELSRRYKPFPNEDAYIGVLADQLALSPIHSSRFTLYSNSWTICNYRYLLVIHHVTVEQQTKMLKISTRAVEECKDQKFIRDWN